MSYLSYYNMFTDFSAGAGVSDTELFTKEEEESFFPRLGDDASRNTDKSHPLRLSLPTSFKGLIPNILMRNDIKSLIGLILFVLAITTPYYISIIMLGIASILIPFPSLVIAYCLLLQIVSKASYRTVGMTVVCVFMALFTMAMRTVSNTAYTISYVILAILFCVYVFNRMNRASQSSEPTKCNKEGIRRCTENSSFYED
ncbi:gp107L [Rabbit fibroma virus]|uniref:Gp107L n=1 Tax=Rabbit fibroma virus (strain Kasza) TaxID=10272 RepID=Q9Q8X1_RFVKA|nr:gp107L [Rabbit fibroma virus]AAF17990.1 gp107L [Rabbit fibroma virus]